MWLSLMRSALSPGEKLIDPPDPGGHLLNTALSHTRRLASPFPRASPPPQLQLHACTFPSPRGKTAGAGPHTGWSGLN